MMRRICAKCAVRFAQQSGNPTANAFFPNIKIQEANKFWAKTEENDHLESLKIGDSVKKLPG